EGRALGVDLCEHFCRVLLLDEEWRGYFLRLAFLAQLSAVDGKPHMVVTRGESARGKQGQHHARRLLASVGDGDNAALPASFAYRGLGAAARHGRQTQTAGSKGGEA